MLVYPRLSILKAQGGHGDPGGIKLGFLEVKVKGHAGAWRIEDFHRFVLSDPGRGWMPRCTWGYTFFVCRRSKILPERRLNNFRDCTEIVNTFNANARPGPEYGMLALLSKSA